MIKGNDDKYRILNAKNKKNRFTLISEMNR